MTPSTDQEQQFTGHCACGAVSVSITEQPDFIHDCNCSLCRKLGAAWGYFPSAHVSTSGATRAFARSDRKPPVVEIHACPVCACTTHWVLSEAFQATNPAADRVGVNMRIFDPEDLEGVEVRFPDGREWSGEGPFDYRRASVVFSRTQSW